MKNPLKSDGARTPSTKQTPRPENQSDLLLNDNLFRANIEQQSIFYDALFRNAKNGFVSLRGFGSDNKSAGDWLSVLVTERDQVIKGAEKLATQLANYHIPAVFCPPIATFKAKIGAKQVDLCEALALSVEIDSGNPVDALNKLIDIIGKPTLIVESGGVVVDESTGEIIPKLHAHWRLSTPAANDVQFAQLKRARAIATAYIGADATNVPMVHPIRWAGSWHTKGEPKLCTIQECNDYIEIDLEIALALLKPLHIDDESSRPSTSVRNNPKDYVECVDNIRDGIEIHHSMVRLAAKRASDGMNEAAIIQELKALMDASSAPRDGRYQERYNDIARTARSAMKFQKEPADEAQILAMLDQLDKTSAPSGWFIQPYNSQTTPDLSQDQLALDLSQAGFKNDARYVAAWGKWLFWDGSRWVKDDCMRHMTMVREFARVKADQLLNWAEEKAVELNDKDADKLLNETKRKAAAMRQKENIASIESLARSNSELVATVNQFDNDKMFLGTPNGTVDLRTGDLLPPQQNHWITKLCAVTPAKDAPEPLLWLAFLNRIFDGDQELIGFIQRAVGYALTGETSEHKLFFLYGTGSNGKSVFLNTIYDVMGDYAKKASSQTFLNTRGDSHPTDLAGLSGARLVAGSELPAGKAWNEAIIKDLTGGDVITARFMRQDFFEFMPQFALFIAGNHQPSFSGIDEAIRRRVVLVPFTQTIGAQERDPQLSEKLKAEMPAILRWAINGAVQWQLVGLGVPETVNAASNEYMEDEDTFGDFIKGNIENAQVSRVSKAQMYRRFTQWQHDNGVRQPWSQKALTQALKERGFVQIQSNGRYWNNVELKDCPDYLSDMN